MILEILYQCTQFVTEPYIEAMNHAIKELDTLPISNRLIKNIHAILLNSVRGEMKKPGEFLQSYYV
jgi:Fic family protein